VETIFFWVGGATVLGIVTLVVSVIVQAATVVRMRPYHELVTALRETQLQLSDLSDHVERKETRERVRRMRDGREASASAAGVAPAPGTPEFKAHLRRVAMAKQNGSA
jgi:hypothetical protein